MPSRRAGPEGLSFPGTGMAFAEALWWGSTWTLEEPGWHTVRWSQEPQKSP